MSLWTQEGIVREYTSLRTLSVKMQVVYCHSRRSLQSSCDCFTSFRAVVTPASSIKSISTHFLYLSLPSLSMAWGSVWHCFVSFMSWKVKQFCDWGSDCQWGVSIMRLFVVFAREGNQCIVCSLMSNMNIKSLISLQSYFHFTASFFFWALVSILLVYFQVDCMDYCRKSDSITLRQFELSGPTYAIFHFATHALRRDSHGRGTQLFSHQFQFVLNAFMLVSCLFSFVSSLSNSCIESNDSILYRVWVR